jgi:4,5-dihydroxyphthalate decarboxylase
MPMSTRRLPLSVACWDYDRTRALSDGRIRADGIDLTYLPLAPEETFFRMLRHREFDVAEMSLSSYVLSLDEDEPPFVAIPVFPSRVFRHGCIFIRRGGQIREPGDLRGARVGIPEYQMTAAVWIRGILAEHHGVPVEDVTYVTGGLEEAGRVEKIALDLPSSIRVERAPEGATLSRMLADGDLDAIYTARTPSTFADGSVTRLFEDYAAAEREFFRATRIFPIMHTVVIRRELYEASPWVARSLYKAFDAALAETGGALHETTALKYALPWVVAHAEETERLMGPSPWAYGLAANRHVLQRFLQYSNEQGLARQIREPESLFVPESLEAFAV